MRIALLEMLPWSFSPDPWRGDLRMAGVTTADRDSRLLCLPASPGTGEGCGAVPTATAEARGRSRPHAPTPLLPQPCSPVPRAGKNAAASLLLKVGCHCPLRMNWERVQARTPQCPGGLYVLVGPCQAVQAEVPPRLALGEANRSEQAVVSAPQTPEPAESQTSCQRGLRWAEAGQGRNGPAGGPTDCV